MKFSKYNFSFPSKDTFILYNSASDAVLQINQRLMEIYNEYYYQPQKIESFAPDFYRQLVKKKFIVDSNINEFEQVLKQWQIKDESSDNYIITINPTLDCNLKCWYCYEQHKEGSMMSLEIQDAIVNLIYDKMNSHKRVTLSFFGGEPFLHFYKTVFPLLESVKKNYKKNRAKIAVHFTTNATLLTNNIIHYLHEWKPTFQIAIDGNCDQHNRIKYTKLEKGQTYGIILSNIKELLKSGMIVSLRCNYTSKNLMCFLDVLSDLKDWPKEEKKYMSVNFHRVWQDNSVPFSELETTLIDIENKFRENGFLVHNHSLQGTDRCYADKKNSIVINYNGNAYKCTARDFCASNREGVLTKDGKIEWNSKHLDRIERGYNNSCKNCRIFPLCRGGCSQLKMENESNSCVKGYNEKDKEIFVQNKILDNYRRFNFFNINFFKN